MSQVVASWSGGKESCFSLYKAISSGFKVSHLLNFISHNGRCMSHGLDSKLIAAQSEAIDIPIVQRKVTWNTYEEEFKKAISELKKMGVEGGVFGDVDVQEHKDWVHQICSELDIKPVMPLWGLDSKQILTEFIAEGFEAVVVMAKADFFDESWLGHRIDKEFLSDLRKNKSKVHLLGELGEYHTFVTNGPLFKKSIRILESKKVFRDKKYWYLDITRYEMLE